MRTLLAAAAVTFAATSASAADWPQRPIEISVFADAGGGTDLVARAMAQAMEPDLGVPVNVVNRVGGLGAVTLNHVWSRPHDGHDWGGFAQNVLTACVMGAHPTTAEDWTFFLVAGAPGVISAGPDTGITDLGQLIERAKAEPGGIKATGATTGGIWHSNVVALEQTAGVTFNFLPFQGSHPSQVAVMTGEADVVLTSISEQADLIRTGQLVPLAIMEPEPYELPGYGTVPAVTDVLPGLTEVPVKQWLGFGLPADTPPEVLERMGQAFDKAMASPEIEQLADTQLLSLYGLRGEEADRQARATERVWTWALYDLGVASRSPEECGIPRS